MIINTTTTEKEKPHWYPTKKFWVPFSLAVALWIYASLSDDYQIIIDVPFVVSAPTGRAIETVLPNNVSVDVSGQGWYLLNHLYLNQLKKCLVNLDDVRKTDSFFVINTLDMQKGLINLNKVTPLRVYPDELYVKTGEIASKEIEIIPDVDINLQEGFVLVGNVKAEMPTVTITGNINLIHTIKSWKTQPATFDNIHSSFSRKIAVSDSLNSVIKIEPHDILIYATVQEYGERTFDDIPLEIVGGKLPNNHKISPYFFSVTLTGGIDVLNKLNNADISISVDIDAIMKNSTGLLKPHLSIPPYTSILNTNPNFVHHSILINR